MKPLEQFRPREMKKQKSASNINPKDSGNQGSVKEEENFYKSLQQI